MTVRTPPETERHLLNRFSYGISPALAAQSRTAGDPLAWFEQQLQPDQIDDAAAAQVAGWFPRVWGDPGAMEAADKAGGPQGWEISADFARWTLMRRLISKRQVHEVMTEFWSNLLHVPSPETKSWPWRPRYDAAVREHALGRFDEMLVACVLHPAMGCYLDNARSTARTPNENLGRELLELHTVGVGGYSEAEVRDSALILTGWLVDVFGTYEAAYSPADHWPGPGHGPGLLRRQRQRGRQGRRDPVRALPREPSRHSAPGRTAARHPIRVRRSVGGARQRPGPRLHGLGH
jgi:uncharacterized protein (DUF1800 family)